MLSRLRFQTGTGSSSDDRRCRLSQPRGLDALSSRASDNFGLHSSTVFVVARAVGGPSRQTAVLRRCGANPHSTASWIDIDEEDLRDQTWGDRWVMFSQEPQVCRGILTAKGQPQNGASVSSDANVLPFVLYRRSALAPQFGYSAAGVDAVAGFLRSLTGEEYYPSLRRADVVATVLRTNGSGEFELVSEWPTWLGDPGEIALGVWGYRPDYGADNLRLIKVSEC